MPLPEGKTAKELGFKVGDKFRVTAPDEEDDKGLIVTLDHDDGTTCPYFEDPDGEDRCFRFNELEPFEKTLEHLSEGDVVIADADEGCTGEHKILAALPNGVYLLSSGDDFDEAGDWMTAQELKAGGYVVKQDASGSPREVTMADVVAKFGENVVIKKE